MVVLIVAIVIALVLFAILRKLAFPVILLLGAGYLYSQFKKLSPNRETQVVESAVATSQPLVSVPMPVSEATVCTMLEDARNAFGALKAEFKAAQGERNTIRRDQLIAQARTKIDHLYSARNHTVLTAIGWDAPRAKQWVLKVTNFQRLRRITEMGRQATQPWRPRCPAKYPS